MVERNIRKKKNKGFTLVELVIVVAILAILVGMLAPQYTKYVENSRKAADASNMDELVNAFKIYALSGGELKTTTYDITIKSGIQANATITEGGVTGITGYDSTDSDDNLNTALNEECPNWGNLQTKSKKWGQMERHLPQQRIQQFNQMEKSQFRIFQRNLQNIQESQNM